MTPFFRVTQTVFGHRLSEFSGLSPRKATRASPRPSASTSPASSEAFRASHRRAALTLGAMRNEFPAKTTQEANKLHASSFQSWQYRFTRPQDPIRMISQMDYYYTCLFEKPPVHLCISLARVLSTFQKRSKERVEGSLFLVHPGLKWVCQSRV